jgi:flagellar basal body-associated protein FliL
VKRLPEKKQRKNRNVIITVTFFSVMVIAGVIFSVYQFMSGTSRSETVSVRIPLIRTPLVSASDGREYNVQTQFYVQINRAALRDVSHEMLEEALKEIMKYMDFDALAGLNGIDYINKRATEQLNDYLTDYTETRVVVTGLSTDDRFQLEDDANQRQGDMFRGIFQNVN